MPSRSSQKPCKAGEREWPTGHPMMPASRALPVILIARPSSLSQCAALAQKRKQRKKRQTENGEVVPVDIREQLDAATLDPVGADRPQNCRTLGRKIGVEKRIAECAHCQKRPADGVPDPLAGRNRTDGGSQLVKLAAQRLQLGARPGHAGGFVEPETVADEDLVGTDDERSRMPLRNAAGLQLGQR